MAAQLKVVHMPTREPKEPTQIDRMHHKMRRLAVVSPRHLDCLEMIADHILKNVSGMSPRFD